MMQKLKIAFIIVLALLAALLVYKIIKALQKPANAKYIPGGGSLRDDWDPRLITEELYKVIEGISDLGITRNAAYAKFNALNDNERIDVYNYWLDKFADEKSYYLFPMGSLTVAMKDEYDRTPASARNEYDIMIANLDRLKLP